MPQFDNTEGGTIAIARRWIRSNFSGSKRIQTILKYDLGSELCIFTYFNWLFQRNVEKNDLLLMWAQLVIKPECYLNRKNLT